MINNQALRRTRDPVRVGIFFVQLCLTIGLLGIILVAAWRLALYPDVGVGWSLTTGEVTSINRSGPAADLVQVGDTIVGIDGQPISEVNPFGAFQLVSSTALRIERDGERMTIALQPSAPSLAVVLQRTTPLVAALALWLVGSVFLLFRTSDARSILFCIFCQICAALLVTGQLASFEPRWVAQVYGVLIWWFVPIAVHLHIYFPAPLHFARKWLLIPLYGLATLGSLLTISVNPAIRSTLDTELFTARDVWLAGGMIAVVGLLIRAYLVNRTLAMRRQTGLVLVGVTVACVPLCSLYLIPQLLLDRSLFPYPMVFLFLLVLPLTYGYALFGYHPIRLDRYVSQSAAFIVVIAILSGLYFTVYVALERTISFQVWSQLFVNLAIALLFLSITPSLYRQLHIFINYLLYGEWYDRRSTAQRMNDISDQRPTDGTMLAQGLVRDIQNIMHIDQMRLFLADQSGQLVLEGPSASSDTQSTESLKAIYQTSPIYHYFQETHHPTSTLELAHALPPNLLSPVERTTISDNVFKLWVPMYAAEQLIGIWVMGTRQGPESFVAVEEEIMIDELHQRLDDQQQLHRQVLKAREEERKRLARELHDEIIQALVGLNYHLSTLRNHDDTEVQSRGLQLQTDVKAVLSDVRRICTELRPPAIDSLGLAAAVRSQLRVLDANTTAQVVSHLFEDTKVALSEDTAICIYRVLQEALSNIQRHAHASRIEIWLTIQDDMVELIVVDDGQGFDVPQNLNHFLQHDHFGLLGVQERLHLLGGTMEVQSQPDHGTRLRAHIQRMSDLADGT